MFPSFSLSFSLPYSLLKLHIIVFIIFLCFICRSQSFFFQNYFRSIFSKGQITLIYKPTRLILLSTCHYYFFFYNHLKFFLHKTLIWTTERTNYNIRMSNLLTVFEVFLFFFFSFFCFSLLVCAGFLFFFFSSLHLSCLVRSVLFLMCWILPSVSDFLLVSLLSPRFKIFIGRFLDRLVQFRFDTTPCGRSAPNFNMCCIVYYAYTNIHGNIINW